MGLLGTKLMALAPAAATALLSADAGTTFDVTSIMTDSVKSVQDQIFSVLAIVVHQLGEEDQRLAAIKGGEA